jgi:trehalose 6-phosphate phosphatase
VELAQNPWGVVADDEITGLVDRLHTLSGGALALVTGRSIDDVDELLPFSGFALAGQHGIELRYSTGERSIASMKSGELDAVREILRAAAEKHRGLVVEDKGMSIALHYRNAPRLGSYAHRLMRSLQARHAPHFALQRGKRVVELKPEGKDKGMAIRSFMLRPVFAGRKPVFVGDDLTDEAGFAAVNEMGGLSVKIGPGRTRARYRIPDIESLAGWLRSAIEKHGK